MEAGAPQAFTILVVDDDHDVAQLIADGLGPAGYRVRHAASAAAALAAVEQAAPDVILLDLVLPDGDGLVLCGDLRTRTDAPIVVCSGSADRRDPILSLRLGADDFVAKPFHVDELEARLSGALRRRAAARDAARAEAQAEVRAEAQQALNATEADALEAHAPLTVGELSVDHARRQASLGGHLLGLTATEYRLLAELAARADQVVTRQELAARVWGHYDAGLGRSIDVHMAHLRAKLAAGRGAAPTIAAVRGFGYRLVPAPRALTTARGARSAGSAGSAGRAADSAGRAVG